VTVYDIIDAVILLLAMTAWTTETRRLRRANDLLHQERVTVAMACSALKNVPDRYDDRQAFVASKLADINERVARRPK